MSKADDEAIIGIAMSMARLHRERIAERALLGRVLAAREGVWSGTPPFGYRRNTASKHLEADSEEAQVVQEVFQLFADGNMSLREVTARVRGRIPRKDVDARFIIRMLRNPVYIGKVVTSIGGQRIDASGAHEAIVDEDLWMTCNEVLRNTI